ncbi:HTH-type transcriptional regulator UlaR [Thorsellia anophelis]|uniref:Transcriptional regulator, DeoR family n=1 Tax=Thorsellia anophelis DSM 18579 TaxID=1123402 RepID=A0A1I0B888_9GAMM|nr:HTH-type transcriptional regulator UlaR [Thorsellia anophelis]SET02978.1 transcriptional regulator, DeoR family [Thorsellia anophelis DSM 18579]
MNEVSRQNAIKELINQKGQLKVIDIVNHFSISPATARRDITKLAQAGHIKKVRNGIERNKLTENQPKWAPLSLSNDMNFNEKEKIAKCAATFCQEYENVIINCGSTAFLLGRELCNKKVSIITNYFPLACYLIEHDHENVIIMGGQYNKNQNVILNPLGMMNDIYAAKWMFTSGKTLTPNGLYKTEILTALSEQQIIKNVDKIVVVVDSSKIAMNVDSGMLFCPLDTIDFVITGKEANPQAIEMIKKSGVEVILV